MILTALLAADSNRPSIDYIGAGRGSLHPALLLTFLAPEVFGASGRMEDYWGPPSFAWQGSGIFLAQNMGQLYIGAIPVILLTLAALRGRLWAREIRFFTVAAGVALLYALGWYTPVFRLLYELLPGVSLYRRPADATFLIGALAAILAGYSTHRLFNEPLARVEPPARDVRARPHRHRVRNRHRPRLVARPPVRPGAAADHRRDLARCRCRRARGGAPAHSAAAGAGCRHHHGVHGRRPCLQQRPERLHRAAARRPTTSCSRRPPTRPSPSSRARSCIPPRAATASSWRGSAFTGPMPASRMGWKTRWATIPFVSASTARPPAPRITVSLPDQRKFSPLFPSYRSTLANLLGLRFIATGAPIETMDRKLKTGDLPLGRPHRRRLHL